MTGLPLLNILPFPIKAILLKEFKLHYFRLPDVYKSEDVAKGTF